MMTKAALAPGLCPLTVATTAAPPIVTAVARRAGTPLEPAVRREFEHRLGHDFGSVRIHSGGEATRAATAVGPRAFSPGRHIAIKDGLNDPYTNKGRRLLTHELTHVAQQALFQDRQLVDAPVPGPEHAVELQARMGDGAIPPLTPSTVQQGTAAPQSAREAERSAEVGTRMPTPLDVQRLPHHNRVRASFGRHDIDHIEVYGGAVGVALTRALGAHALASGNRVAFGGNVSLHTAAHEAAHVVQQRAGFAPSGGLDRPGDDLEQHADRVAAAVVRGASAEGLLDEVPTHGGGSISAGAAVQRQVSPVPDTTPTPTPGTDRSADEDIRWVATLDEALIDEIDGRYSDVKARKVVAAAIDAETRARQHAVKSESAGDVAWTKQQLSIEGERRKDQAAEDRDQMVQSHNRNETAVDPSGARISRSEGQHIARTNFVKWTTAVLGSVDRAKAHYGSIKPVPGIGILLTKEAGARLLAARTEFEAAHAGFTIAPGGGFSMRDLHEARNGVGMLGHALGVAIDIRATRNPNIKLPADTKLGNYGYLIERLGADASGKPGRSMMTLDDAGFGSSDRAIEALGKATAAGRDTLHDHVVKQIRQQFGEMVATSTRLQQSMARSLPLLQDTRTRYFQWLKNKADTGVRSKINDDLKTAFQPWLASIEEHASVDKLALAFAAFRRDANDRELKEIDAIDTTSPDATTKLNELDVRWKLSGSSNTVRPKSSAGLKKFLQKSARAQRAMIPSGSKTKGSIEYLTAELGVLDRWQDLLLDPARVFGSPARQIDVAEIPVMQLIERGFVESSPMMGPIQKVQREDVFNADVAATLARYGFAPGATFGDTMHFDFIEGYSHAVPGGRSRIENMNRDRFGPLGLHGPPAANDTLPGDP